MNGSDNEFGAHSTEKKWKVVEGVETRDSMQGRVGGCTAASCSWEVCSWLPPLKVCKFEAENDLI